MILQPNKWSCLPTAFSYILDVSIEEIFRYLGHDGSEILWPHLPEPFCRRSFHTQEMIYFCNSLGFFVTPFEAAPQSAPQFDSKPFELNFEEELQKILFYEDGVVTGESRKNMPHAIAWKEGRVFDPSGICDSLDNFSIETFFQIF